MDDGTDPALRRAATRSRRVLLVDPASAPPSTSRFAAPDGPPPVAAPAAASSASRPPDELVVVCTGAAGDSTALRKLQPSERARAVRALVGDIAELRGLRSGALVFVAKTTEQVGILLQQSTFCAIPVVMRPPKPRLAANFGVVSGVDVTIDPTALRSALVAAGATEYSRLRRRAADGSLVDSRSLRVAFPGELPSHVFVDYVRHPVRPFVHRPLQCFRCQRYGHGAAHCRSAPRCGRCSGQHASKDCSVTNDRCAVCGDAHPAWSRECPHRVRACRVEFVRATERLSYAAAVQRVPPIVASARAPRPTLDVSTQTDFPASPAPSSGPRRAVKCQTVSTPTRPAASQTSRPPRSDDSTLTEPVVTIRRPPKCLLFAPEDTGGEETAVFPLTDLQEFAALLLTLLEERSAASQKTSAAVLTRLALDRIFTEDFSD